jgi:DHA2 family multidrug resistance protein-like MFS transporter
MFGAAAFAITSVIAAMSTSADMLIGTRALLGLAGATLAPSTLSLIRNMFLDPDERTFAIGVWITSYSAGGAIGPILGGIVLEHFPWGVVFLLGVPVMLLLLALGPMLLPEYRDPDAGRPDLVSAGMSLISVLLVIYGIKQFAEHGPGWLPAASILAGLGGALGFVRRQRRLADPLIDLQLFKSRAFSASLATYMLGTVIAFGAFFFLAQYLQMVLGLSPLKAGFGMLPFFCGFIAGTLLVPAIVRRVRPGFAMAGGLVLAAIGFVSGLLIVIAGSLVFSLGLSPVFTLATDLVVGNAPPERAGAAAAISETSSELGGALGIAILGSIGAAVYRGLMADAIPAGVPAPAADVARSTLGGALAEAARLPGALGAELVSTSRDAFMRALELTATISAVIALGSAILAAVLLREVRR